MGDGDAELVVRFSTDSAGEWAWSTAVPVAGSACDTVLRSSEADDDAAVAGAAKCTRLPLVAGGERATASGAALWPTREGGGEAWWLPGWLPGLLGGVGSCRLPRDEGGACADGCGCGSGWGCAWGCDGVYDCVCNGECDEGCCTLLGPGARASTA